MKKLYASVFAVVVVLGNRDAIGAAEDTPKVQLHFEWAAYYLPCFPAGEFAYDRIDQMIFRVPKSKSDQTKWLLRGLMNANYPIIDLVRLLNHADPKVRTLALAALFDKEDPRLLPLFLPMLRDKAITTRTPGHDSSQGNKSPPMERQTVGNVAATFLDFYVGPTECEDFKEYWAARKDRKFCVNWFQIQLARASQGITPAPEERHDRIRAVRKRIDEVPMPERAWILLRLHGEAGGHILVTNDELVKLCKELGPDRLMQLLQYKIPSDDPDLQPQKSRSYPYYQMMHFVLYRAAELLRKEDAEKLPALGNEGSTAWWFIAAAELYANEQKTQEILVKAMSKFGDTYQDAERSRLAAAIWRMVGPSMSKYLIHWFYDEPAREGVYRHSRASFLASIAKVRAPDNRKLLLAIVQDKRFESLDLQSLQETVDVLNSWSKKQIVDTSPLQNTFPQNHADWRKAITSTIPQWSK